MTRLKLAVLLEEFLPYSQTFVFNQIKELSLSFEVHIISFKKLNDKLFPIKNLHLVNENKWKKKLRMTLVSRGIFITKLFHFSSSNSYFILKKINPDAIIVHFGVTGLLFKSVISKFDVPIFLIFHGVDATYYPFKYPLYRQNIRSIISLKNIYPVFVSYGLLNEFFKISSKNEKSKVIHLGVDTDNFKPQKIKKTNKKRVFTSIGRLVEKKGFEYLIKAFSIVKHSVDVPKNLVLNIIGDGPLEPKLKQLVKDLDMVNIINFHGIKSEKEIIGILQKTDVYIQTSIRSSENDCEGLPISILEAMAVDLPIIASNHSGIPEAVEHNKNGILVEEKNINQIAKAIIDIENLNVEGLNRKKIISQFSIKQQTNILKTYINQYII